MASFLIFLPRQPPSGLTSLSEGVRTIAGVGATGHWVRYGDDAATALRDEIRQAKDGDPLRPVTVVVPSNQVGVSVRRQLASHRLAPVCGAGPGLIAVSFLTPYRLAELLGASSLAAAGRRPVSTPVLTAAVRAALAAEPGHFAAVATHPATESALVAAYRELREASEAGLDALAARGSRAQAVVQIHRAARSHLVGGWYDEQDLMHAAAQRLVAEAGSPLGGPDPTGVVIVYLPQRLTPHGARLLREVGARGTLVVLAGGTGVARADAEVAASVARLSLDLGPAPSQSVLADVVGTDVTHVLTASDADDEVRGAVRRVVDAVRAGTALDRIAVLHASSNPYGRLLREHLTAAGLEVNGSAEVTVAARMAGRTLLGLLDLPSTGFGRQEMFAWLSDAPIRYDGRAAPTAAWERVSRSAGVVAGRADWDGQLHQLILALDQEASQLEGETEDETASARADRKRADASRARSLRTFALGLIDALGAAATTTRPWSAWSRWAKERIATLLGRPERQARWPDVERRAAERIDAALDRLGALDQIEPPVGLDVFARTLVVELESDLGRIGRFGQGVLVGPVSLGVGVDLDLVVVVGLAEGTFPSSIHDDSLLPDADRLALDGAVALRRASVDRLHHQFLAVLGAADSHLLCVPRGDLRRSSERVPSRWALDVAAALSGTPRWKPGLLADGPAWLTNTASFDQGVRCCRMPATAQEHRLRTLLAQAPHRGELSQVAAAVDATAARGVEVLDGRQGEYLSRFDGNLDGLDVPSPIGGGTSATRLERWADCPFAYFLAVVLRVQPLEQPEDQLQISALDKGNLVHRVLEDFLVEILARSPERRPTPGQAWAAADHDLLDRIAAWHCEDYERRGLTGRPIFWRRDRRRVVADLHRFLHADDARRHEAGCRPVAAELAFGRDETTLLEMPLRDGRSAPVRGQADRVDVGADGTIHVLDYKTGSSYKFKNVSQDDPHEAGTRLQLAVYAQAARRHLGLPDAPVEAAYWFVSSKEKFARKGYGVTDEVLDKVGDAMTTIVSGIEAGLFVPRPKPPTTSPFNDCWFCDPDDLGTAELRRQWTRKSGDPMVAAYRDMAEPPAEPEPDADAATDAAGDAEAAVP